MTTCTLEFGALALDLTWHVRMWERFRFSTGSGSFHLIGGDTLRTETVIGSFLFVIVIISFTANGSAGAVCAKFVPPQGALIKKWGKRGRGWGWSHV